MRTKTTVGLAAVVLVAAVGSAAAFTFQQFRTYRVRIYNETGVEVRIKSIGLDEQASYSADYDIDESKRFNRFIGGQRVVAAWDDTTEQLVAVHVVDVNGNGRIHVFRTIDSQTTAAAAPAEENGAEVFEANDDP